MAELPPNFFIEPSWEKGIEDDMRQDLSDMVIEFLSRYGNKFDEVHLHFRFKQHKERKRDMPLMFCRINMSTDHGLFHAETEGWGSQQAMKNALEELHVQIEKKFGRMESTAPSRGMSPSKPVS